MFISEIFTPYSQKRKLNEQDQILFKSFYLNAEKAEAVQVKDLFENCYNKFQFAKQHSVYLKDWEETKNLMIIKNGRAEPSKKFPEDLFNEMIDVSQHLVDKKLDFVRKEFFRRFHEDIYIYLGSDGKTKKFLGIFDF